MIVIKAGAVLNVGVSNLGLSSDQHDLVAGEAADACVHRYP
jgi:hypothetical protein